MYIIVRSYMHTSQVIGLWIAGAVVSIIHVAKKKCLILVPRSRPDKVLSTKGSRLEQP